MTYERDVIIEREGTGIGTILGIILAVVVVLAIVWYFFLGGMAPANDTTPNNNGDTNITIEQPQPPPVNDGGAPSY